MLSRMSGKVFACRHGIPGLHQAAHTRRRTGGMGQNTAARQKHEVGRTDRLKSARQRSGPLPGREDGHDTISRTAACERFEAGTRRSGNLLAIVGELAANAMHMEMVDTGQAVE